MSVSPLSTAQQITAQPAYRPPPRPDIGQDAGTPSPNDIGSNQGTGATNPFARLVTDLQAALVSMQGATANGATAPGTAATDASATSDPMATLKTDLQSIITQFQSGGTQGAQGAAHPHHHHRKDTDSQAAATGNTATSPATPNAGSPPGIVDRILQAFQSAMQAGPATTATGATNALSVSA